MLWVAIGIAVIIGLIMVVGSLKFQKEVKKTNPEYIVQLLNDYREDEKVALSVIHNGEKLVEINDEQPLPLASTVQVIIAIEFARQAAANKIDPNEKIPIKDLETFNIPKTDGKAFNKWMDSLTNNDPLTDVSLRDIAQGMIYFSSNANTDFLIQTLGLEEINQVPKDLDLDYHEPVFPIVSSLSIPVHLQENKKLTEQQTIFAMRDMDPAEYRNLALEIHEEWLDDPPTRQEKRRISKGLSMPLQRAWSDRLPHSTAKDYVKLMEKLNSKEYFSPEVHQYLDPLLEQPMKQIDNMEYFRHFGQKGGITSSSVTLITYATDKNDQQISLAFFANDLNPLEHVKTSRVLHQFQNKLLKDEDFRAYMKTELENIEIEMDE